MCSLILSDLKASVCLVSDPTTDGGFSTDYITDWQYSCEHRLTGISDAHVTIRTVRIARGERGRRQTGNE